MADINEQIRPHPNLKKLYYTYLAIATIIFLAWILPVTATAFIFLPFNSALIVAASLLVPLFFSIVFIWYWTDRYYASISYALTDNEIAVHKGVWWKRRAMFLTTASQTSTSYRDPSPDVSNLGQC